MIQLTQKIEIKNKNIQNIQTTYYKMQCILQTYIVEKNNTNF